MANPNPASDVITKAVALSPYTVNGQNFTLAAEGSSGANAFVGPVRATKASCPNCAVFARNIRGLRPEPYIGAALNQDLWVFHVEITVRSNPGDFAGGEDLVRGLLDKLHRATPTGYVSMHAYYSGPEYLGEDEERRHEWSFVVELWWKG